MKTPSTLIELLDLRFERDGEKTAYVFLPGGDRAEQTISYAELFRRSGAIARLLSESTEPGARILLLHPPSLGFVEAILGCIRAGRVAVPVGTVRPNRPGNHLASIRRNCAPAAVLVERAYYDSLVRSAWVQDSLTGLPTLFNDEADGLEQGATAFAAAPDTLAVLQYTSGSTRAPRGVMITHGNLMANMRLIRQAMGFDPDTRMFGWLPFFHDMGLFGNLLQPLDQANPSVLMPPMHFLSEPVRWLRGISRFKATISGAPNFAYDLCVDRISEADRAGLDLSSWKVAFNGSEPVSARTLRRFTEAFAPYGFRKEALYPCYGMAECTLFVSGKRHLTDDHLVATTRKALAEGVPLEEPGGEVELVSCGTSWPGQTIAVVDPETLTELATGRIGEIWIAGAHVSVGYWENPEGNAESFGYRLTGHTESFLRTGDLGFVDTEGRLYITGRRKELIIVRGRNHYPQDLEDTAQSRVQGLLTHRGAVFTEGADPRIILVQEVKRSLPASDYESVALRIREEILAGHGISLHEVILARMGTVPLTSSGKIQRLKCRELLAQGKLSALHRSSLGVAAQTSADTNGETEAAPDREAILEKLVELIRKHGPRQDVTVNAAGNFVQYGLDSVTSVVVIGELGRWLKREIEAVTLWEFPSLGQLAAHLAKRPERSDGEARAPAALGVGGATAAKDAGTEATSARSGEARSELDAARRPAHREREGELKFSLLFFASEDLEGDTNRYELLLEASRFADQNGFHAVWVPERHFHAFGGLYPSPSVLAAALARETTQVRLRAGSVVLPINSPVRVAEEWSLVDNLSGGRVDLAFAQGWNANDFVLAPSAYDARKDVMFEGVETIRKLWRGEEVALPNGRAEVVPVRIHPAPLQRELAIWITCSGSDERFVEAGTAGCNILTALLFQSTEELFRKLKLYRDARSAAGHPGPGLVTLMLHTFVHPDALHVRRITQGPFLRYLETSTSLWRQEWDALSGLSDADREKALEIAYARYASANSLMGSPGFAAEMCAKLRENGVDEIACLVDFGVPMDEVMSSLVRVAALAGHEGAVWTRGKTARDERAPAHRDFEPIAVIGVAAKVPGAETAEGLWENLKRGVDSVSQMPPGRWSQKGPGDLPRAGWLPEVDLFDAEFFQISPHEAVLMDPQQRLFLETAWTCVQDAGYCGPDLKGSKVGVYVGAADSRYDAHFRWNGLDADPHMLAGNTVCTLPARLSYYLDLRGPCLALDTACSSSLVAIHEACRAIQNGECEAAIAGGVSLLLTPDLFQVAGKAGMLSDHGQCRAFDAAADGYVPGEGAGAVFLKPLSAALRDGDSILGIIRGSALNHDGRTNGITAPNPKAQVEVAREALRRANATPDSIGYVECHGTGTHLGDPIEFKALQETYGGRTEVLPIGSIKSNIGHLLAAAGVASFLKALFCLKHRLLVPSLHFEQPNPNLDYGPSPLRVMTEVTAWEAQGPRRAAVSSFGHSGTNCTLILEEFVAEKPARNALAELCVVSGRNEGELREYLQLLAAQLFRDRSVSIASVARTLALGRVAYPCRVAFVASSAGELAAAIRERLASGMPASQVDFAAGEAVLRGRNDARGKASIAAALSFLDGGTPDWEQALPHAARARLPAYPLHPASYWPKPKHEDCSRPVVEFAAHETRLPEVPDSATPVLHQVVHVPAVPVGALVEAPPVAAFGDPEEVMRDLSGLLARLLECDAQAVNPAVRFIDVGADSIILMDVLTHLQIQYGLTLPMGELFEPTDTLEKLCARVLAYVAVHPPVRARQEPTRSADTLEALQRKETVAPTEARAEPRAETAGGLLDELDPSFVDAYCEKTARSKRLAQEMRAVLADNRASAGFRLAAKELVFPLSAEQGQGVHIQDQDGNRYLDITMGFGVHLFGHNPHFVREALSKAVERGFVLGPNSPLAGDVARRVARLTGHARVAFCNSGTEAVMSALRLARNFTGKPRIALFSNSYHGHSDGVLAHADGNRPLVPGIPDTAVAATSVLPYGDPSCFERLDALRGDLAAVLVEPVQARNPGHQPFEFLARLREWTQKRGVVLIFDEMISGFRVAAGGVQELLGFKADLGTYGKIAGGGMPIGIVAGESAILNGIDGGYWSYGDASAPTSPTTFFAGTFSKHPLTLEAARATLEQVEAGGKQLYLRLNANSDDACRRLNAALREEGYPGEVRNFGSLFRFFLRGKQDAFFYRMAMNGVYVWEGRNCFLSTEHGPAEVDTLVNAVRESVRDRVKVHLGPRTPRSDAAGKSAVGVAMPPAPDEVPALESQRQLWALSQIDPARFSAYNECHALRMTGSVDVNALQAAAAFVQNRHELLRSRLSDDGTRWLPVDALLPFSVQNVRDEEEAGALILEAKRCVFDIKEGPLWSLVFLRLADGTGHLLANFHHLIVDGWSFAVLLEELALAYNAFRTGADPGAPAVVPFARFVAHQRGWVASTGGAEDAAFWQEHLAGYSPTASGSLSSVEANTAFEVLPPAIWENVKAAARRLGGTPSALLLSAYLPLLWEWRGKDDVVVAVPVSARTFPESSRVLGYCAHVMPLRFSAERLATVGALVAETQRVMAAGLSRQNYPFSSVLTDYRRAGGSEPGRLLALGFNFDRTLKVPTLDGARWELSDTATATIDSELNLTLREQASGASLFFQHRLSAMNEKQAALWIQRYVALLLAIVEADPGATWRELAISAGVAARARPQRAEAMFAFE